MLPSVCPLSIDLACYVEPFAYIQSIYGIQIHLYTLGSQDQERGQLNLFDSGSVQGEANLR